MPIVPPSSPRKWRFLPPAAVHASLELVTLFSPSPWQPMCLECSCPQDSHLQFFCIWSRTHFLTLPVSSWPIHSKLFCVLGLPRVKHLMKITRHWSYITSILHYIDLTLQGCGFHAVFQAAHGVLRGILRAILRSEGTPQVFISVVYIYLYMPQIFILICYLFIDYYIWGMQKRFLYSEICMLSLTGNFFYAFSSSQILSVVEINILLRSVFSSNSFQMLFKKIAF